MKLGFLGTGAITSAMVTGLGSAGGERHSICLSPRNAGIAAGLASRFPQVAVASSNQQVVDECEIVVIAVRPPIAPQVLSELRFRSSHHVISLVAGLPLRTVCGLVGPATQIARAVPLPSAAQRRSPTAIYPRDPVASALFASLGEVFAADAEDEFDALLTATAADALYFAIADGVASWLARRGVPRATARQYVARMYRGVAEGAMEEPARSFQALAADHATPGGLNEQVLQSLTGRGLFEALSESLEAVMRRLTASR